jgi:hypothetical protein
LNLDFFFYGILFLQFGCYFWVIVMHRCKARQDLMKIMKWFIERI